MPARRTPRHIADLQAPTICFGKEAELLGQADFPSRLLDVLFGVAFDPQSASQACPTHVS